MLLEAFLGNGYESFENTMAYKPLKMTVSVFLIIQPLLIKNNLNPFAHFTAFSICYLLLFLKVDYVLPKKKSRLCKELR